MSMEADERYWLHSGKYLGKFVRHGTLSYHHEAELIFEYGTVHGNVICIEVPKQYSWDEIVVASKVNEKTLAYFTPIYAGQLYSHNDFLEIIDEMREEQQHKHQLDVNQQQMDDLDDNLKDVIQNILNKST